VARISRDKRSLLTETRRKQVLDAAVRLCSVHGFDGTTVEAIAREAGISKGTLYLYFPNKTSILEAALERHSMVPDTEAMVKRLDGAPPTVVVPEFVRTLWRSLGERAELIGLALREVALRPELGEVFLQRELFPNLRLLADYLGRWSEAGVLRPIDPTLVAGLLCASLLATMLVQDVLGGRRLIPMQDEDVVRTASELFLRGLLRDPAALDALRGDGADPHEPITVATSKR
jgi:AcrR family transcriptional regulator